MEGSSSSPPPAYADLKPGKTSIGGVGGAELQPNGAEGLPEEDEEEEAVGPPPRPPRTYLWLSILTCFCPAYPVNIVAFVLSVMATISYTQGDTEGSKRLGNLAFKVAIASILIGSVMIGILFIVHFTTHAI